MSACEKCWTEASRRSAYTGKSVADLYPAVLREHDGWMPDRRDEPCGGVASNPGHLVDGEWVFEDNDPECCEVHMLPWGHKREHPHGGIAREATPRPSASCTRPPTAHSAASPESAPRSKGSES